MESLNENTLYLYNQLQKVVLNTVLIHSRNSSNLKILNHVEWNFFLKYFLSQYTNDNYKNYENLLFYIYVSK